MNDAARWNQPIQAERKLRVICIGAGASGLIFAYKLQRSFTNIDLMVYEKNKGIAGTWFENKYPGCACDIPSHAYTYSFEPNSGWSSVFAGSDEIESYFNAFATKYDLYKYCKTLHQVVGAHWEEEKGSWRVNIHNLANGVSFVDDCHVLVNASGILNSWKWPEIEGLEMFNGPRMHTAHWDKSVDLRGKHVAVIGNGASAIQIIPAIYPVVGRITTFIRSPTWVTLQPGLEIRPYTEEEKHRFANDPSGLLRYRKKIEARYHDLLPRLIGDAKKKEAARAYSILEMKDRLGDDVALAAKLTPDWSVGCRRVTPGPGYLETLRKENVEVVLGEIDRITETGCIAAQGRRYYQFDVLICATGFDTSFVPRFPIVGRDGKNLVEEWVGEPKGYFGLAAAGFPNYFTFIGPNSPIGSGALPRVSEVQADYMLKFINRLQTENIHSFAPKAQAVEDFIAYKDRFMPRTVWTEGCRSWYKNGEGKIIAVWPGTVLHYMEAISDIRYDHWDITYSGNMFAYLGNGYSQTETDPSLDKAYYITDKDTSAFLSTRKAIQARNRKPTDSEGVRTKALL
ncbi:hypothetical protein AX16_008103 [Volvariella volvacea WC 439]|nr:hypothetical protein AX16_008103 [Volvariella volvacea WC 439]